MSPLFGDNDEVLAPFIGALTAATCALLIGLAVFDPLVDARFDLAFFSNFSLRDVLGSSRYAVQFAAAGSFGLLSGLCYYLLLSRRGASWSFPVRVIAAIGSSAVGVVAVTLILGTIAFGLGMLALIYGLFFGPGDR